MSTPQLPIYMNYSATTPVDSRMADKMIPYLRESFGNPASRSHPPDWEAGKVVETAHEQVAVLVNAGPCEIAWALGTTESDNLVIKGAANFYSSKGKYIITVKTEHKVVPDTTRGLERQGFGVTYLGVKDNGLIDTDVFKQTIRPDTILVSVMMMNNEIGVTQDIEQLGETCREKGVIFHVDAAQATGKAEIGLQKLRVDLIPLSVHKIYGSKGIGALYVCRKPCIRIEAQMHDGGHECGMRSGMLAMHQIVSMGETFHIAKEEMATENERIRMLRDYLHCGPSMMEEAYVNGDMEARVPRDLNISFNFAEGESLIMAIKDVAVSSGLVCTSASPEPSYVLCALGRNDKLTHSSIRFTVGHFTTEEEVDYVVELLESKIGKLRDLSPLWEMYKDGVDLNSIQWAAH